jgi:hypothetical protein
VFLWGPYIVLRELWLAHEIGVAGGIENGVGDYK